MNERCFCQIETRETRWSRCKIEFHCVDNDLTTEDPIRTTTQQISTTDAPQEGGVYLLWWHITLIYLSKVCKLWSFVELGNFGIF